MEHFAPDDPGLSRALGSTPDERLFDEYAALALEGRAPDPELFLEGRGEVSAELRESLRRVHRRTRRTDSGERPFERLGEFKLIRRLGSGGMGLVFLAEQTSLGRQVALKVVRPELSGSAVAAERFQREARAVAQLRHPGIVTVYAVGEEHGVRYLAMELVPGRALDELLRSGEIESVPIARRVRWILELAQALDYAHRHGVVHRDVKPSNVRITPDDRALLLDFGLARVDGSDVSTLTDGFAGSPAYASPEQISESATLDLRTDVYSLGVTLYQCLAGRTPFAGRTMEELFHRILTANPTPLRRIEPEIPRDLETVAHKAIERDPARRYASAGEFADDLLAVLELRPIQGRPPSAIERVRRAARRHPALATACAASIAIALVLVGLEFRAAGAVRNEAREAMRLARERVADYQKARADFGGVQREVERLRREQANHYQSDDEYRLLDLEERRVAELRSSWEALFYEVLELLRRAERLDPEIDGAERVRAELYLAKYREARDADDVAAAQAYRRLVVASDPSGELANEVERELVLSVASDPPGAEVFVFRYAELSELSPTGEPRMVPVPVGGPALPVAPGTWALRVVDARGDLRREDLIVAIDGRPIEELVLVARGRGAVEIGDRLLSIEGRAIANAYAIETYGARGEPDETGAVATKRFAFEHRGSTVELEGTSLADLGIQVATATEFAALEDRPEVACSVFRDGELFASTLRPATDTRTTATPILISPSASVGRTPIAELRVPAVAHLFVLRREGCDDFRLPLSEKLFQNEIHAALQPAGSCAPGWVYVPTRIPSGGQGFWIMEREVTAAEYLAFLNEPETLAQIDAASEPILYPRQNKGTEVGPLWERDGRGEFRVESERDAQHPVLGISWEDARSYARWKTRRAREAGLDVEFALPVYEEFVRSGTGELPWIYSYGPRFRAKWAHTCFAHPTARPGRVMQHPVDESVFGVYDCGGSALEWLETWYDQGRGMRWLGGGGWGQANPEVVSVTGGLGGTPKSCSGESGMRLVMHRSGGAR